MASSLSSRLPTISGTTLTDESLSSALRPWRRRLSIQQLLLYFVRGVVTGLVFACLIFLLARLFPWASAPIWALAVGLLCPLLALIGALWARPSLPHTAHRVDKILSLHDRMGTAWEIRAQSALLPQLQRHDALAQLRKYAPRTAIALRIRRPTLLTLLTLCFALGLLLALPNPMMAVLKQQAQLHAQLAREAAAIHKIEQQIAQTPAIPATEKQQINQALDNLTNKLQNAQSPTDAQQALSDAQAKIDQLRDPQANSNSQAQAAAGKSLQSSSDANLQAAGKALSGNNTNGDNANLAKALQNLANQAGNMSASQRSQLAQQIEKAANDSSQSSNLSSALHQLAKAVADGNASEIKDASQAVSATSQQTASNQAQDNAASQASQGVQNTASDLATATDNTNQGQQAQGQPGQNGQQSQNGQQGQSAQGQGQQNQSGQPSQNVPGQGQAQGQGQQGQSQGQQGQGQGQGQQGQGQGQQGQSQGQGSQGQGGAGNGSGGNNNTGQQGKNEPVYVQGQQDQGSSTTSNDNNSGVTSGGQVPYSQVVQQYDQAAHNAIDNSNVSPDMKDLVHNYFNSLEGQH